MITHDLGVVAEVAEEIAVMYAGRIVEYGKADTIFAAPEHPYTWGLLKSIPRLDTPRDQELVPISGRPPSLINKPPGCSFHPALPVRARGPQEGRPAASSRPAARTRPQGRLPAAGRDAPVAVGGAARGRDARARPSRRSPIPETTLSPSAEGRTGEEVPGP